jgi:general L-amino acid transport system permease protein
LRLQDATGKPANVLRWILLPFLIVLVLNVVIGLILEGQLPFAIEVPRLDDNPLPSLRKFEGGGRFTFAFLVVLLGLVFYTSAFIADIVRAGILSVPKGQIEAARAAGLNSPQTLRLVVLPQAMRLIVPPLTNQYLNLSKNSSLGLAVGFWDLFNVTRIIDNNTGQSIAVFIIIMLTYLMLSLIISFIMNSFNQSLRLKTR